MTRQAWPFLKGAFQISIESGSLSHVFASSYFRDGRAVVRAVRTSSPCTFMLASFFGDVSWVL